ncbi:MAG: hypothetical protein ABIF11_03255 [Nitrospirota bacterium]
MSIPIWEGETVIVSLDTDTPCLEWINKGGVMTSEEFHQSEYVSYDAYLQYKKDYPALEWFVDARQLRPMDPQDVDWVAKEILPKFGAAGLTREAFVIPQNAMAKLAIHQYETKAADGQVTVRMFGSVDEAKQWLKEAHLQTGV